jgi:hypothetical protein
MDENLMRKGMTTTMKERDSRKKQSQKMSGSQEAEAWSSIKASE